MATESKVNRTDDPSTGDDFATYDKASGAKTQAMNLDPEVAASQLSWVTTGNAAVSVLSVSSAAGGVFKADVIMEPSVTDNRWLMVFDSSSAPANAAVPILRARIAGGFASIDLSVYGRPVANGVAVAISTTVNQLTLPASGEGYFQVGYV